MKQTVLLADDPMPCNSIKQVEEWEKFRGKPIVLVGAPVSRERLTHIPKCDSDLFWRVDPDWVAEHWPNRGNARYFVCRHEIQAGD